MTAYRDFEIHIHNATSEGVYPVTAVIREGDWRAVGELTAPFTDAEIQRAQGWMEQGLFDTDFVREFGAQLFRSLITGAVQEIYTGARLAADTPLRLRLIIDAPRMARIPWELLYDLDREIFLALAAPLVRGASLTEPARDLTVTAPLRILVVDAFPQGVLKVQDQLETAGINEALAGLVDDGRVEVTTLSHITLPRLQNALREAAVTHQNPFHVLHFIGHGQQDPVTHKTVLLFEMENGQADGVDAETLAGILRPYDLRLIFLNACQSVQAAALDLANGFAPRLMSIGIPAVIGMQVTVLDEVAIQVSHHFYAALADGQPLDAALTDARQLLRGTRLKRKADMGIPVGYLRTETGQIINHPEAGQARPARKSWRARLLALPVRAILVTGTLLSLVGTFMGATAQFVEIQKNVPVIRCLFPYRMKMDTRINVAVTQFPKTGDWQGADQIFNAFKVTFLEKPPPDLQVDAWNYCSIPGTAQEDQRAAARELSRKTNANMVIYGVSDQKDLGREKLLVFLNKPEWDWSELFTDTFFTLLVDGSRDIWVERSRALMVVARGLSFLTSDTREYQTARDELCIEGETCCSDPLKCWPQKLEGKEMLYLLRGSSFLAEAVEKGVLIREARSLPKPVNPDDYQAAENLFEQAEAQFNEVEKIRPGFPRARLGKAMVVFNQEILLRSARNPAVIQNEVIAVYDELLRMPANDDPNYDPNSDYFTLKLHYNRALAEYEMWINTRRNSGKEALAEQSLLEARKSLGEALYRYEMMDAYLREISPAPEQYQTPAYLQHVASASYFVLGNLSFWEGSLTDAQWYYSLSQGFKPQDPAVMYNQRFYLGYVYEQLGGDENRRAAIKLYREILAGSFEASPCANPAPYREYFRAQARSRLTALNETGPEVEAC